MKPAPFEYYAPATLEETLDLLAEFGERAKLLAGGQSLVPLLNFRLARPEVIIDLNRVAGLADLALEDGALRCGAMVRQRSAERSPLVQAHLPILVEALGHVGHWQIRNRGTIGGSLAHADPSAELPAVAVALDAHFDLRSRAGVRRVPAGEFFVTYLTTALRPDELLAEIHWPLPPAPCGHAFLEVSRRHGDFALVGVAALLVLDERGRINWARLALTGVGPTPERPTQAEAMLLGERPSEQLFQVAGEQASAGLEPESDLHASAEYRREVAAVLVRRTLQTAAERALKLHPSGG